VHHLGFTGLDLHHVAGAIKLDAHMVFASAKAAETANLKTRRSKTVMKVSKGRSASGASAY